jgi:UDP-N-acetyl-D-mannosaminuronate dehydrogenase
VQFAAKGHTVVGADVSARVVKLVNEGSVPFPGDADLDIKRSPAPVGADAGRGLRADPGRDLFLVFSPERLLTGRIFADLRRYPKLVGGINEESARRGVSLYEAVLDFDDRPELPRRTASGTWVRPRRRSWRSSPRPRTGT